MFGQRAPGELVARASRTIINVIAGQQTVIGNGRQPGYLEGYGVIDADQVRDLASEATLRLLTEPAVSPAEALRYQPTAALERWIRMRDLTCRHRGVEPQMHVPTTPGAECVSPKSTATEARRRRGATRRARP
jgi:hypothetical protein